MSWKTRFAPSTSGYLHIGNLKIAIINLMYSKWEKCKMLLRIDNMGYSSIELLYGYYIIKDLKWLEIFYDYIFIKSSQIEYKKFIFILIKMSQIYYCLLQNKQCWIILIKHTPVIRSNGIISYIFYSILHDINQATSIIIRGNDHYISNIVQCKIIKIYCIINFNFYNTCVVTKIYKKISKKNTSLNIKYLKKLFLFPSIIVFFLLKLCYNYNKSKSHFLCNNFIFKKLFTPSKYGLIIMQKINFIAINLFSNIDIYTFFNKKIIYTNIPFMLKKILNIRDIFSFTNIVNNNAIFNNIIIYNIARVFRKSILRIKIRIFFFYLSDILLINSSWLSLSNYIFNKFNYNILNYYLI